MNMEALSKKRNTILGIATIMLMLFHSYRLSFNTGFVLLDNILTYIKSIGNIGVELFLMMSGLGLYYSFKRNSNVKDFYKKRIVRIVPELLITSSIIFYLFKITPLSYYLENVFLISFFTRGVRTFWYFDLILILYLFYPLLHKLVDNKKGIYVILVILVMNGLIHFFDYDLYHNIEIALTRIPSFIVGIYFGKLSYEKKKINIPYLLPILIIFLTILNLFIYYYSKAIPYHIIRYTYLFQSINILLLLSYVKESKILNYIGNYSMKILVDC